MEKIQHLLSSSDFGWGLLVMGFVMLFMMFYSAYMRMQSLYMTAKHKGREKIGDKFYYLVEESEYNRLTLADLPQFGQSKESEDEHV